MRQVAQRYPVTDDEPWPVSLSAIGRDRLNPAEIADPDIGADSHVRSATHLCMAPHPGKSESSSEVQNKRSQSSGQSGSPIEVACKSLEEPVHHANFLVGSSEMPAVAIGARSECALLAEKTRTNSRDRFARHYPVRPVSIGNSHNKRWLEGTNYPHSR
jgi:hypothetical protein